MNISDAVKYRAAEKLARKRSANPTPTQVFQALQMVQSTLEVLIAIHDAIQEAENDIHPNG